MTTLVHNKQLHGYSLVHSLTAVIEQVQKWIDVSHQRRQLAQLDAHMLRDIGLDADWVRQEVSKPFWK